MPVTRALPPTDQVVARPVAVPKVRAGDDARVVAVRMRGALGVANKGLDDTARRYEAVRQTFAGE